ncbi:DDE-type integrase/transposase/recombinase (plasmid) [Kocuria rhizophila]|nr:DDE-type integrase/transposase/recombinase [Kocuria rhizophila]
MAHIDVKKTGRIPDGGGWRAHGKNSAEAKAVARTKTCGVKTGYVFLHSAIDGYSRLAYTEALPDEKAVTAVAFLDRARAWFAAHGITQLERIVTDNGSCYRAAAFAHAIGDSRHQRITPYTPRHNGKLSVTTASWRRVPLRKGVALRAEPAAALEVWNRHYNYHRPHGAHGGQPPASTTPDTRQQRPDLIQLAGYEVYRFGGAEFIDKSKATAMLTQFFNELVSASSSPSLRERRGPRGRHQCPGQTPRAGRGPRLRGRPPEPRLRARPDRRWCRRKPPMTALW